MDIEVNEDLPTPEARTQRINQKKTQDRFKIPEDLQSKAKVGIQEALKRLNLTQAANPVAPHGNKPLSENSIAAYQKHINLMNYFCSLIGDYDSMLMLLERPPQRPPSMSAETISLAMKFKRKAEGTPLTDSDDQPVTDVNNQPIPCQGGWNDPKNCNQLLSSLASIHKARGVEENEPYCEPCDDCILLDKQGNFYGCNGCRGRGFPRLWRRGNPCMSAIVQNTLRQSTIDAAGYKALGDSPWTPQEFLTIRQNLMSKGLPGFLQYTQVLVGSFMFSREDEVSTFKTDKIDLGGGKFEFNCINWDITVFSASGEIEGLGFTVFGKSDKVPVNLIMWRLDDCPMLCPVRHLLGWIFLSGITSGYLFPSATELSRLMELRGKPGAVMHCKEAVSYTTLLQQIKHISKECIPYRDGPFGTHTMRKNGYLLAYWGGGEDSTVFKCARHASPAMGAKYKRDAESLMAIAQARNTGDAEMIAPKWRSIFVEDIQLARSVNRSHDVGIPADKSIYSVAFKFITQDCRVAVDNPVLTPIYISNAILSASRTTSLIDELNTLLGRLEPGLAISFKSCD
ncbi:hypothetical protein BCR33DRAFT_251222 [Rhizoclosmatium globosum]|uniref:Uncharacterized protein n=1 Tax=Rhizoclosmatium globosum TaxID=329046 RepID=A0A1Y2C9Z0_9FUNG|nr:hypothetical protein BCR33DRAFT_251222 [Rhizoclosmatium globosum]|eukprot:ORY43852.1 hypothetical protein BCR33DRAFT_251222 [Rhizoclosmatium globosum]